MDVDVALGEERLVDAERSGAVLDDRERRLRALLHHVAELARENEPAVAADARCLDEEDVAADRRPGEPGRDARHARAHRHLVLELQRPEHGRKLVLADADRAALALGDAHGRVAQRLADLALEIAHAGFARVVADDLGQARHP